MTTRQISISKPHGWYLSAAKAFLNLYTEKSKKIYLKKSSRDYLRLIEYAFGFCDLSNLLHAADALGYNYEVDEEDPSVYYFDFIPRHLWKQ